jgi:hypothetical protein
MWSPSTRLMFIGVSFPVFTPSTITSAPDGKDVTFNVPAAAGAIPITNVTRRTVAIVTGVRITIPLLPSMSPPNAVHFMLRHESDPVVAFPFIQGLLLVRINPAWAISG